MVVSAETIKNLLDAYVACDGAINIINAKGFDAVLVVANDDEDEFTEVKLDQAVAMGAIQAQQKTLADALLVFGIEVS